MPVASASQRARQRERRARKSLLETESARRVYDPVQGAGVLHHHQPTRTHIQSHNHGILSSSFTLCTSSSSSYSLCLVPLIWRRPHLLVRLMSIDKAQDVLPPHKSLSCRSGHTHLRPLMFKCSPWTFCVPYPSVSLAHSSHLWCHHSLYLHSFLTPVLIELCSVSPVGLFRVPFHKRGNVWAVHVMYAWHSLMSKSPYGVSHSSALWTLHVVIERAQSGGKSELGETEIGTIGRWMQVSVFTPSPLPKSPQLTSRFRESK